MSSTRALTSALVLSVLLPVGLVATDARAYIDQADGTVVPQTTRLQQCLDLPATAEAMPGAVDAIAAAAVLPEAYRPVFDAVSGHYRVTFIDIGEGAGFSNSFGWFWVGTDVTNTANLHTVFGCRTYATCNCPCTTTRTVTIDFDTQPGFSVGRPISFWLRTPERLDGTRENGTFPTGCTLPLGCDPAGTDVNDSCGGRLDGNNRIYFTSQALNDDGDYRHFLVYRSVSRTNTYYFGFEDLYRGGDNDFEDMLVRGTGLVPDCDPRAETCDNVDNDCDMLIDEDVTQACSTSCGSGVRMCTAGSFGACSAPVPTLETCNDLDDNCNGTIDEGLTRACTNACGAGTEVCVAGTYTGCTAPTPRIEACNGIDDDCDMMIDEGLSRTCSSACGVGTEMCMAGSWVGCTAPMAGIEVCNNLDDDCDGVVDDGNPGGGAACVPLGDGGIGPVPDGSTSTDGGVVCANGRVQCIDGALVCRGSTTGSREVCNCLDDDCDGQIDEQTSGDLCPGGLCYATECQCVDPCGSTEFSSCPPGEICNETLADPAHGIRGYCVLGMCAGVTCTGMEVCNPLTGACVDPCAGVTCGAGLVCLGGACVSDNCYGRGCPRGQLCRTPMGGTAACVADPCASVTCSEGTYCADGTCVAGCAGGCRTDQVCTGGTCVAAPCGGSCTAGQSCIGGTCAANRCATPCGLGRVCSGTTCVDDPCLSIRCPTGFTCHEGACWGGGVDEGPVRGLASGGGPICSASPGNAGGSTGLGALWLVLLGLVLRRARKARAAIAGATVVALSLAGGGCTVEPYCFTGCGDHVTRLDAGDTGTTDAGPPVDANVRADGCIPTGPETCNNHDDDCNGIVDDGFDVNTDPANCGRCGNACAVQHAFPACTSGSCGIDHCQMGWHDIDGLLTNGCEYACPPSGDEICDRIDNDCDMMIDEGIDTTMSLANCGGCGNLCTLPGANVACVASTCTLQSCRAGFVDLDLDATNGCEYRCTATGAEMCNGVDDNCDGNIDEGFDTMTDPMNCGTCGTTCSFPHATPRCALGICAFAPSDCLPGFQDIDGNPLDGCEYACTPTGAEMCNGLDDDCNGMIDDALTTPSAASVASCAEVRGVCAGRTPTCRGTGGWACDLPATYQAVETLCDGLNNDCDAMQDEGCITPAGTDLRLDTMDAQSLTNSLDPFVIGTGSGATARLHVGWRDLTGGTSPHVYTTRSLDGGGTFPGAPVRIDTAGGPVFAPRMVLPGATGVFWGWPDFRGGTGYREAWSRRSSDSGATLQAEVKINGLGGTATQDSYDLSLANVGTNVYATWETFTGTRSRQVFAARSTDSGATWSTPTQLSTPTGTSFVAAEPRIAASGTNVFVAWRDNRSGSLDVWLRASTDSGATFGPETRMDVGTAAGSSSSFSPAIAANGTNAWVVWIDDRDAGSFDVWMNRTSNSGGTWLANAVQLDQDPLHHDSIAPHVVSPAANVVLVSWLDYRFGQPDPYSTRSADAGATFDPPLRLDTGTTPGASASHDLDIAASGTLVAAVWSDSRSGSTDIYSNFSLDQGVTWQPQDYRLDSSAAGSSDSDTPRVWATTGAFHAVWVDHRRGASCPYAGTTSCPNGDIYYRRVQ